MLPSRHFIKDFLGYFLLVSVRLCLCASLCKFTYVPMSVHLCAAGTDHRRTLMSSLPLSARSLLLGLGVRRLPALSWWTHTPTLASNTQHSGCGHTHVLLPSTPRTGVARTPTLASNTQHSGCEHTHAPTLAFHTQYWGSTRTYPGLCIRAGDVNWASSACRRDAAHSPVEPSPQPLQHHLQWYATAWEISSQTKEVHILQAWANTQPRFRGENKFLCSLRGSYICSYPLCRKIKKKINSKTNLRFWI